SAAALALSPACARSITEVRSSSCDTALAALLANSPTTATNTGDAPRSACTAPSAASIVALISCSRSAVVVMPGRLRACWPAKAPAVRLPQSWALAGSKRERVVPRGPIGQQAAVAHEQARHRERERGGQASAAAVESDELAVLDGAVDDAHE